MDYFTPLPQEQYFALPEGARRNEKGNILFSDPSSGAPLWVPADAVLPDGRVTVEPQVCPSCAAAAAGVGVGPGQRRPTMTDVRQSLLQRVEAANAPTPAGADDWVAALAVPAALFLAAVAIVATSTPRPPPA